MVNAGFPITILVNVPSSGELHPDIVISDLIGIYTGITA
jgi:hypothetical protein